MIQTIRVYTTKGPDLPGIGLLHEIQHSLDINGIKKIRSAKVYRLEGITQKDAIKLSETAFYEDINQEYTINAPLTSILSQRERKTKENIVKIEIAYKPGVICNFKIGRAHV